MGIQPHVFIRSGACLRRLWNSASPSLVQGRCRTSQAVCFPVLAASGACHLVFLPCMQHKGSSGGDGLDPGISEGPRGTSGVAAGAMPEMPPEAQPDSSEPPFQRPPMWHPQVNMPAVTHCRPLRMLQCQNMKRITCNLPHAS